MSRRASSAIIGAFVVGAAALAVILVVLLGGGRWFKDTRAFVVYFPGSVSGLESGSPVKFKGVDIGTVRRALVTLSTLPAESPDVRIPVIIEVDPDKIGERAARDLTDPRKLREYIAAGLRAQLQTISLVTNLRYVSLDVFPGSPVHLEANPAVDLPEIPALPSTLETAEGVATRFLNKISKIDVDAFFARLDRTLAAAERLVTAPELLEAVRSFQRSAAYLEETSRELSRLGGDLRPELRAISASVRAASENAARATQRSAALLDSLTALVKPAGPAVFRLEQTLDEVAATARSLRRLVDRLDRDPAVLLRGGAR